jgi:hypothetical protein
MEMEIKFWWGNFFENCHLEEKGNGIIILR